jgi:hypothetical protein
MKNIINLTPKTIAELENIIKFNDKFRARKRAEAILLSYKGKTIPLYTNISPKNHQIIYIIFFRNPLNYKHVNYQINPVFIVHLTPSETLFRYN